MRFFADPTEYTHLVRFYGFPAYYRTEGEDGCAIEGTNAVWDWCVLHIAPMVHCVIDTLRAWTDPDYESCGWQIEIVCELQPKP